MNVLELNNVCKNFGGLKAIDDVSFCVKNGSIFGLIGPNGAGKTTLFNLITANLKPTSGTITFLGNPISNKPHKVVNSGIARTFQNIRLFDCSVLENILVGLHHSIHYGFFEAAFRFGRFFGEEAKARKRAMEILDYVGIAEFANTNARALSYGQQRKVEIARALACAPKLLLLDEPAAGMNTSETDELAHLLGTIRNDFTLSLLLIEHDMPFIHRLCEHVVVLDYGKVLFSGTPKDAVANKEVIAAYLGVEEAPC